MGFFFFFSVLWLKLLQHQLPEKLLLSGVVVISLASPRNDLMSLLSQASVYCPAVAHLLKQIEQVNLGANKTQ